MLRHILRVVLDRFAELIGTVHGGRRRTDPPLPEVALNSSADRDAAMARLRMEQALALALEREELVLYLQPILRLRDRSVAGFEALIRWRRADGKLVPPGDFLPVAEDSSLIIAIGHWVFRSGCCALRRLGQAAGAGASPPFVSVNLSARQFQDDRLVAVLADAIRDAGVAAADLRLEITETTLAHSFDAARSLIDEVRGLGCRVAIDDFGSGYSSLNYLHRLPVDIIKLDQAFVRDMFRSPRALSTVRALALLARELGMACVAEGVEDSVQHEALQQMGLEYVQGYYYGRPMPLEDALAFLAAAPGA